MSKAKLKIINEELFKIGKYELIKFTDENGEITAVFKKCPFKSRFGNNNNLAESDVLKKLKEEILPYIENIVGTENVLEFETDLLSLDGSRKHGLLKSKISVPTLDFYRYNRSLFEKYKLDEWWWLATPDTTSEYYNDFWARCVSPRGYVYVNRCGIDNFGVRPVLHFDSSIFVSSEE